MHLTCAHFTHPKWPSVELHVARDDDGATYGVEAIGCPDEDRFELHHFIAQTMFDSAHGGMNYDDCLMCILFVDEPTCGERGIEWQH